MKYYLIGSLRNPEIPKIGNALREIGLDIFDDWFAGGPIADDSWKEYEQGRGHTYQQALSGLAARHVFEFDKHHLDDCDGAVLALPAGKSGHLELGYMVGRGKYTAILLDNPDRWDVMYQFATNVYFSFEEMIETEKARLRMNEDLYRRADVRISGV